ncbi:hypothetical protein GCM10025777_04060 [Membranihabitans marinus]
MKHGNEDVYVINKHLVLVEIVILNADIRLCRYDLYNNIIKRFNVNRSFIQLRK